jgi:hypothetical protein
MKTSMILFVLSFACSGKAQKLLDENNLWMDVHNTINFGVYYEFFQIQSDTIIASKEYRKLYHKYDEATSKWEYIYGIREDSSGKVYFVQRDNENERLLYDFNLQLNDTFFICNNATIYVTSIDTVMLLNGELRKRIQFEPGPETWIEGIGSTDGIVADGGFYYCITFGEDFPFLNCFTKNGEILYMNEWSSYPCLDGMTALPNLSRKSFSLYPNPFSSNVTIVLPNSDLPVELNIFNLLGELLHHQELRDQYTTINRNGIPSGIYIFQLVGSEGQIMTKKVMIISE